MLPSRLCSGARPLALLLPFALLLLITVIATITTATPAQAEEPPRPGAYSKVQIHLITMGDSDDLLTSGGHASLMVARMKGDAPDPANTIVYNYGNTDWEDPQLVPNFLVGKLKFFLATSGTLSDTINEYGVRQGRETWRQKLNLTDAQADEVARRLLLGARPENRSYGYHHYKGICTTGIRDLLDDVTGGALRRQLSGRSSYTVRDIQQETLRNHPGYAILADLFFGRMHDLPIDEYTAAFVPWLMRDYFLNAEVPNPSGGPGKVTFADAPVALTELPDGTRPMWKSHATVVASIVVLVLIVNFGGWGYLGWRTTPRVAGLGLAIFSALFGLIGLAILYFAVVSRVPELRMNENALCFLPTDFLLLPLGWRWIRGRQTSPVSRLVRYYTAARLALSLVVLPLHVVGVLYQQPSILCLVSLGFSAMAFLFVRRGTRLHALAEVSA